MKLKVGSGASHRIQSRLSVGILLWVWVVDVTSATIHAASICESAHVALCRSVFVSLKRFQPDLRLPKVAPYCQSAHGFNHGSF